MKIFFIIILCLANLFSFSQNCSIPVFSSEILENPSMYRKQYEYIFSYNEISKFKETSTDQKIILENGYAAYIIKNFDTWLTIKSGKKVKSITIVYTKYPRKKKDWIMNYDELLANRLKYLFKIDPELNRKDIKWYLLLQTECKNDKEARTFFHGIVITYEREKSNSNKETTIREKQKNQNNSLLIDTIIVSDTSLFEQIHSRYYINTNEFDKSNSFIYRETTPLIKKKKRLKVPGCPDFSKKTFKKLF